MMKRCLNPADRDYASYGGRGITVCDDWQDPERFICDVESAIGLPVRPRNTLDRVDNALGYQPGNVKWATRKEQAANRRPPPPRTVIQIGQRFGRGVVTGEIRQDGYRFIQLHCDCGQDYIAKPFVLTSEKTRSCGCWFREHLFGDR
jgi:hypothetical protein